MLLCSILILLVYNIHESDWVSACWELQFELTKTKGRGRKTWNECVKVVLKMLGLVKDDDHNRDKWKPSNTSSVR